MEFVCLHCIRTCHCHMYSEGGERVCAGRQTPHTTLHSKCSGRCRRCVHGVQFALCPSFLPHARDLQLLHLLWKYDGSCYCFAGIVCRPTRVACAVGGRQRRSHETSVVVADAQNRAAIGCTRLKSTAPCATIAAIHPHVRTTVISFPMHC